MLTDDGNQLYWPVNSDIASFDFDTPSDLTLDDEGNIYVVNGTDEIYRFNSEGEHTLTIGSTSFEDMVDPTGIVVHDTNIYVADQGSAMVYAFNADGEQLDFTIHAEDASPTLFKRVGITIDGDGHIFVVDASTETVYVFISCWDPIIPTFY